MIFLDDFYKIHKKSASDNDIRRENSTMYDIKILAIDHSMNIRVKLKETTNIAHVTELLYNTTLCRSLWKY